MTPSEILEVCAERSAFVRANSLRWSPARGELSERAGFVQTESGALIGIGDVPELTRLIDDSSIEAATFALMPIGMLEYAGTMMRERFRLVGSGPDAGAWDWMYTRDLPPVTPGEEYVVPLEGRFEEIAEAIAVANPETSAAENLAEHEWWGYQRNDRLLGVCGIDNYGVEPGTPDGTRYGIHLSGLGTRPEARRQGVGSAMMAAITRHFVGEFGLVHYGVWSNNGSALRVYRRLGYSTAAQIQNFAPAAA